MTAFHKATFRLLGAEPIVSAAAESEIQVAERRLGMRLPASVREWYSHAGGIDLLRRFSNQDCPIPLREFLIVEWEAQRLVPFKNENQGVCVWAVDLDGSDDPPVFVDVDSNGTRWTMQCSTFSAYVYSCIWDHVFVFDQLGLVEAQNDPLSPETETELAAKFAEQPSTFGWPGNTQHRFMAKDQAILIWSGDDQADWFVAARDAISLDALLRTIWELDGVGKSFYDVSDIGRIVLNQIRGAA